MITAPYYNEEPLSRVIGPQLGPDFESCGVRITIALPHRPDIKMLTCRLLDANGHVAAELDAPQRNVRWRQFLFGFPGLSPGAQYHYSFWEGHRALDLDGGLLPEDCNFTAPVFREGDRFVLLSCNNPFDSRKIGDARFAMWERLAQQISQDARIKLVIQGGDQVYHDSIETECLTTLQSADGNNSATSAADESVARAIIRNYQHFYGHPAYRKIMASVPSVAMLDDHDITDGWGGRQDSFDDSGSLLPQWQRYFDLTYDAFKAYQALKNPPFRIHSGSESTYLDFGQNRLFLLDLRREKNVKNLDEPLVSRAHEAELLKLIETTPAHIAKVFVLSPVVPVRPDEEERLVGLTSAELASDSREVGDVLLEAATGQGALLVMGAYGHWRWHEWVFGGATHYVMRNATVPVLMMH